MDQETFIYQDSAPYPPIEVCGPNLVVCGGDAKQHRLL